MYGDLCGCGFAFFFRLALSLKIGCLRQCIKISVHGLMMEFCSATAWFRNMGEACMHTFEAAARSFCSMALSNPIAAAWAAAVSSAFNSRSMAWRACGDNVRRTAEWRGKGLALNAQEREGRHRSRTVTYLLGGSSFLLRFLGSSNLRSNDALTFDCSPHAWRALP